MTPHPDEQQLNDCADDVLPESERGGVEAHLATCTACRDEVERIRMLRTRLAALPRDIAPPAHVLLGVHARIAADSEAATAPAFQQTRASGLIGRPRLLAAAAVLLVALSSGTTALLLHVFDSAAATDSPPTATAPGAGGAASLVAVQAMERSYQDAIAQLQRALREQPTGLAPETLRVLQTNLEIIDRALAEARTALHADPGNDALTALLRSGYERKLDVLRSATSHSRARS